MQDNTIENSFPFNNNVIEEATERAVRRSKLMKKGLDEQTMGRNQRSNNHYLQRRCQRKSYQRC